MATLTTAEMLDQHVNDTLNALLVVESICRNNYDIVGYSAKFNELFKAYGLKMGKLDISVETEFPYIVTLFDIEIQAFARNYRKSYTFSQLCDNIHDDILDIFESDFIDCRNLKKLILDNFENAKFSYQM